MQIKVLSKDDGYWLSIDGQEKALINLGVHGEIVTAALEEAAQQEATSDGAKCAACGSLNLVPAVHCQDCGYSLPPRA